MANQEAIDQIQSFLDQYNQLIQNRNDISAQLQALEEQIIPYDQALNQIATIVGNISAE